MSRVTVVGGGLAGIAAALSCADGGAEVTLVEVRPRLGGAAYSFERDGMVLDNGQLLSNGWMRWAWTTGSGQEPVIIPGDGRSGPRFQLAEGDWLVGFRPEPSSAQLAQLAGRITGDRERGGDVLRWVRAIRLDWLT